MNPKSDPTPGSPQARQTLPVFKTLLSAALAAPVWLAAQAAPALPAQQEAAIRINPFEVLEAVDDSFVTSSVGTGGRLVLELKDVPAAYYVINRSVIDALGITDIHEAAGWAPGQSFDADSGSGSSDGRQTQFQQRGFTQDLTPNSTNTSGASTGVMRNFYQNQFSGNQDSYAVETFDFGQGPNGVLFGGSQSMGQFQNGGAAGLTGVSSVQTKRARLDASRTSVVAEFGAWDYRRFQLDHNRPLTQNLGVRINLVDLDSRSWLQHRENLKRGITVALRWQITPRTDLTMDISTDKSMVHAVVQPSESWSGWDGRTTGRGLIDSTLLPNTATNAVGLSRPYGQIIGASTALNWAGEANGVERFGGNGDNYYFDYSTENTIINMRGMLVSRRADSTTRVPLWSKTAPNGQFFVRGTRGSTTINGVSMARDVAFGVSNRSWLNMAGLPQDMFERQILSSKARPFGLGENLTWEGPAQDAMNKDIQFAFSHRFTPTFSFGLGGDLNRTQTDGRLMDRQTNNIRLDLNQLLPNGTPNPHFLEMFSASGGDGIGIQHSITTDKAIRFNIAYTKNLGRWGDYALNVNGNANTRRYDYGLYQLALTSAPNDPVLGPLLVDPRAWIRFAPIKMLLYDSYNKGYKEPRLPTPATLINTQWVGTGTEGNTNAFTPTATTSQATMAWVLNGPRPTSPAAAVIQDFTSKNLALQSTARWLDNKLVFLGGYRRDFNSTVMMQNVLEHFNPSIDPIWRPASSQVPTGRWDGVTRYFRQNFPGTATEYYNLSYKVRNAAGVQTGQPRLAATRPTTTISTGGLDGGALNGRFVVADPRYQSDVFRNDFSPPAIRSYANTYTYGLTYNIIPQFSPYVNFSDQVLPPNYSSANDANPTVDLFGVQQLPVVANGKDFGFRFSLLRGKIQGKYNYFMSERVQEPAGNDVISSINNLITAAPWNALVDSDSNRLDIVSLNGNGDYQTRGNNGWEAELNVYLSRAFRLTLNGGAGSRYNDLADSNQLTRQYMADPANHKMFLDLLEDAGGSLDTSVKPVQNGQTIDIAPGIARNTPVAGKGPGIDVVQAVNAYNNIWLDYDELLQNITGRTANNPTANVFADYTVQSGIARGLRVGAGVQWQGPASAGNRGNDTILYTDPTLGVVAIDDPSVNNQDFIMRWGGMRTQANAAYTFTLPNRNTLAVALRVSNIGIKTHRYGLVSRQPEGDLTKPNRVQMFAGNPSNIQDPMNLRLTLTYSFASAPRGASR